MLNIQKNLTNSFYLLLSLPATAMGFGLCIQISTLSWKLDKLGLDAAQVGIVWSAGPIAGIIGQLLFGFISDKSWFWGGRRKPYMFIGGLLTSLMILALAHLDTVNTWFTAMSMVAVATIVALTLDLAINISFNPTRTVIADVTPDGAARTRGYTWMQTVSGFFGVLAYFIGALWGKDFLFYFGAVLVLLFTFIPAFLIKEPRQLEEAGDGENAAATQTDYPNFIKLFIAHAFTWLGVQSMFIYFYIFLKDRFTEEVAASFLGLEGLSASFANIDPYGRILDIGFMLMNIVGFILPIMLFEPLSKTFKRSNIHMVCMSIMAVGYFGILFLGTSPFMICAMMVVIGIGWAAVVSLPFAIFTEMVDKSKMGLFMGIFNLSVVLPQLGSSFLVGKVVNDATSKDILFWICGISLAISAALWLLVKEKD